MLIELKNGTRIDIGASAIKRLAYQNIRGNRRYFVAVGNDNQAVEYEMTFDSYMNLVGELHGQRRNKAEGDSVLPGAKRNNRKAKADQ